MKLRELRKTKGLTQKQLSQEVGVPVRTIARWENGETDMFLKSAIKLAEYFEVTLNEFIE